MTENQPEIDGTETRSRLKRRPVLASVGLGLTMILAGCNDEEAPPPDDDDDDLPDDDDDDLPDDDDDDDPPDDDDDDPPDDDDDDDPPDDDDDDPEEERATMESITADEGFWDPDPATFSGTEGAVEEVTLEDGFTVFAYSHTGDESFTVSVLAEPEENDNGEENDDEEDRERIGTPVVGAGEVEGIRGMGLPAGEYGLDIQADGEWELTVAQPQEGEEQAVEPPAEASGTGEDIVGPIDLAGDETVTLTHEGAGNFIVEAWMDTGVGSDGRSIWANVSGEFEDEVTNEIEGLVWVAINADADWSIDVA